MERGRVDFLPGLALFDCISQSQLWASVCRMACNVIHGYDFENHCQHLWLERRWPLAEWRIVDRTLFRRCVQLRSALIKAVTLEEAQFRLLIISTCQRIHYCRSDYPWRSSLRHFYATDNSIVRLWMTPTESSDPEDWWRWAFPEDIIGKVAEKVETGRWRVLDLPWRNRQHWKQAAKTVTKLFTDINLNSNPIILLQNLAFVWWLTVMKLVWFYPFEGWTECLQYARILVWLPQS